MPEFDVKQGKNGTKIIRRKGKSVIIAMWNADTGDVQADNELTERIAACLNFFEGTETAEVQRLGTINWETQYVYDHSFEATVYDYNRHGIAAFQDNSDSWRTKGRLQYLAQEHFPLMVQVFRKRDGRL